MRALLLTGTSVRRVAFFQLPMTVQNATAMPRYFTAPPERFPVTLDLRDDNAAWKEVVEYAGEMLREIDGQLPNNTDWQLTVATTVGTRWPPSRFKRSVTYPRGEAAQASEPGFFYEETRDELVEPTDSPLAV
jgi:hypothetical protein